jgi:amphiphysin
MKEILTVWENDFKPLQSQIETGFELIAKGKAVRLPFHSADRPVAGSTVTGLGIRNGIRGRVSSSHSVPSTTSRLAISPGPSERSDPPSPNIATKPAINFSSKPSVSPEPDYPQRITNTPYQGSLGLATPNYSDSGSSGGGLTPHYPAAPRADYFSRERNPSQTLAQAAAGKKKPPPPPPKRKPSDQSLWVTALYDFSGQGQGDLNFREGDKIRVTKKTPSTDDWWEGELNGVKGPFPANYVQVG